MKWIKLKRGEIIHHHRSPKLTASIEYREISRCIEQKELDQIRARLDKQSLSNTYSKQKHALTKPVIRIQLKPITEF